MKGSEILEVLHSLPNIQHYLFSLYNCHYSDFFSCLGKFLQMYIPIHNLCNHSGFMPNSLFLRTLLLFDPKIVSSTNTTTTTTLDPPSDTPDF